MSDKQKTHYRACNLCEAICGLEITVKGDEFISIKGDKNNPLSKGHICPKGVALQDIYHDPNRLKQPLMKTSEGWRKVSWDHAFNEAIKQINKTQQKYGNDAVSVYQGNPTVHNMEAMLYGPTFFRSLRTSNHYSATSVDQLPEQLVSLKMFGHSLMIPLSDLDRAEYIIIIGANPVVSNGSMMTAPGVKKRLKSIQNRGGKVVVIDPRQTETADLADEHYFITPGSDALFILSMLHVIFSENLADLKGLPDYLKNISSVESLAEQFPPESVEAITGIASEDIKHLAREFCQISKASCYGRIGVSTHEFGTLTQWLITVLNIVAGKLDKPGGVMFNQPAIDVMRKPSGRSKGFADRFSRVRGLPNFAGEFPVATLADEILTEGDGQIKTLITHAGNPILSTPNGSKLAEAFEQLDYMICIDFYLNETTKYANLILPPATILQSPHYDLVFQSLAIRNTATYSEAIFPINHDERSTRDIFLELTQRYKAKGFISKIKSKLSKLITHYLGSEAYLNKMLKQGFYGQSHKLNMKLLKSNPSGIDIGPLQPCLPERLFTQDKTVDLAPSLFVEDVERLQKYIANFYRETQSSIQQNSLLLIGRRDPRTNNSWLHNSQRMVKGKNRCTVHIHPDDAKSHSIANGHKIKVSTRVGSIEIEAHVTDKIKPGVISIPHGWGHNHSGTELDIANKTPGVNVNLLTDEKYLDECSGNVALNGVSAQVATDS